MKRLILLALSFGLVTTIASAQEYNNNAVQEGKTKSKAKTETEMKDHKTKKSETEMKEKDKAGKSEQKMKSKQEPSDKMDQGARSSQMNWNKSSNNTWIGVDDYHYRVNSSGQLEKSQDGTNWRLSQSGRWQDDQGNYYRIKENKLESSKDGNSWAACPDNTWKGKDNTMYKYSESDKVIYSSQGELNIDDQKKDVAPPSREPELIKPDSMEDRQPISVPIDSVNFLNDQPRRDRRGTELQHSGMNMQDEGSRFYNLEVQDPMQDRTRGSNIPASGKLPYKDSKSPK